MLRPSRRPPCAASPHRPLRRCQLRLRPLRLRSRPLRLRQLRLSRRRLPRLRSRRRRPHPLPRWPRPHRLQPRTLRHLPRAHVPSPPRPVRLLRPRTRHPPPPRHRDRQPKTSPMLRGPARCPAPVVPADCPVVAPASRAHRAQETTRSLPGRAWACNAPVPKAQLLPRRPVPASVPTAIGPAGPARSVTACPVPAAAWPACRGRTRP